VLGAVLDLVSTWLPLRSIGWGFEGNPLGIGLWAVLFIKVFVCVLVFLSCKRFVVMGSVNRFGTISFLTILFLAQVFAATNNFVLYKNNVLGNDEFVRLEDGSVNVYKDGFLVNNLKPKVGMQKLVGYYSIVFFIGLYPYFIGLLNFWLTKKVVGQPES